MCYSGYIKCLVEWAGLCLSVIGQSGGPRTVTLLRRRPIYYSKCQVSKVSFLQVIDWIPGQFFRLTVCLSILFNSQPYLRIKFDFCVDCPLGSVSFYSDFPAANFSVSRNQLSSSAITLPSFTNWLLLELHWLSKYSPVHKLRTASDNEAQAGPDQLVLPSRERGS